MIRVIADIRKWWLERTQSEWLDAEALAAMGKWCLRSSVGGKWVLFPLQGSGPLQEKGFRVALRCQSSQDEFAT